jgi:hypothetical protein
MTPETPVGNQKANTTAMEKEEQYHILLAVIQFISCEFFLF